jgi:hypothetical protein
VKNGEVWVLAWEGRLVGAERMGREP